MPASHYAVQFLFTVLPLNGENITAIEPVAKKFILPLDENIGASYQTSYSSS